MRTFPLKLQVALKSSSPLSLNSHDALRTLLCSSTSSQMSCQAFLQMYVCVSILYVCLHILCVYVHMHVLLCVSVCMCVCANYLTLTCCACSVPVVRRLPNQLECGTLIYQLKRVKEKTLSGETRGKCLGILGSLLLTNERDNGPILYSLLGSH